MAIGNGTVPFAEAFVEELEERGRKPTFPIVTDPGRRTYEAFAMPRAKASDLGTIKAGLRAYRAGHRQTRTRGDAGQNGGVLVIDTGGKIVYRHIEGHAGDLADVDEVIEALRGLPG